jgi:hypothetical protein
MANYTRQRRKSGRGGQTAAKSRRRGDRRPKVNKSIYTDRWGNRRTVTDIYDDLPF